MAEPIEFKQYPGRASQLGSSLGQGLIQGIMQGRERKREASAAQGQFLTNLIRAAYNSGQIGPLQAEEAYKRVQAGEGLPEIMRGLKAPQKQAEVKQSFEKKEQIKAKYKRDPEFNQLMQRRENIYKRPGITSMTGQMLPESMWPERYLKELQEIETRLGAITKSKGFKDPWSTFVPSPPEPEVPKVEGIAGYPIVGEIVQLREIRKAMEAEGHSEIEIESVMELLKRNPGRREEEYLETLK